MPTTAPYGSWKSPITADLITSKTVTLMAATTDGNDVYWIESRPLQSGRHTIMRWRPDGAIHECTPPDFYVRSTVHEYGGGAFVVSKGTIYFTNYTDQRLYRQPPGGGPELLTPGEGYRYADLVVDERRNRLICIREDHTRSGEAVNTIVGIPLSGGDNGRILANGSDFYSSARLNPDGTKLAYLTWNHPNMPWDGCELWVTDIAANGELDAARRVAGSNVESIFQPAWSPDGVLHFVAESSGWWNLYRWDGRRFEALYPMEAEFGKAQWNFGMSTYGFASPSKILSAYSQNGVSHLAWLDTSTRQLTPIDTPYADFSSVVCGEGFAAFIAGSPTIPPSIVRMDTERGELITLRSALDGSLDTGFISTAEAITYPTGQGKSAHAHYYPPKNRDFVAPTHERPPLLVFSHGGPTSAVGTTLNLALQYWTSRGFAVIDVNYGGSTGYGPEYRKRLNGQWGVVDVDDCCNAALFLAERGSADRNRMAIRGGSAGGYTTLACLAFRSEVFRAGASHYGLSDLVQFVRDTHKFESRYLSSLVGAFPEQKDLYLQRSPINFTANFSCPLILFQGDEDKIVPPSQSQMMFEAARSKGLPVAYLLFHGEQHGFRKAENIKRSLEAELYFYSKVFGFELRELIGPVRIVNL